MSEQESAPVGFAIKIALMLLGLFFAWYIVGALLHWLTIGLAIAGAGFIGYHVAKLVGRDEATPQLEAADEPTALDFMSSEDARKWRELEREEAKVDAAIRNLR